MRRWSLAFTVAAAIVGVTVLVIVSRSRDVGPIQATPGSTQVRRFDVQGVPVHGAASGTCYSRSIVDPTRPDAWRCIDDTTAARYDPCIGSGEEVLLCAAAPWDRALTRFTLRGPLPAREPLPSGIRGLPWAVELANGERCVLVGAAGAVAEGREINFTCGGHAWAVGGVDRGDGAWKINYYNPDLHDPVVSTPIVVAWR